MSRIARLDALRAYCVIGVFLFHAHLLDFGWIGVQVFFVLSGFLITGILLDYKERMGAGAFFAVFYWRRALRIFPPYYAFLALSAAVAGLGFIPGDPRGGDFFRELPWLAAYLENIRAFARHYVNSDYYSHLWTLATEEQFYLVWPLALWLTPASRVGRLCFVALVGAIFIRSGLAFYALFVAQDQTLFEVTTPRAPFCAVDAFAMGALMTLALRGDAKVFRQAVATCFVATACAAIGVLTLALLIAPARAALFGITAANFNQLAIYLVGLPVLNVAAARIIAALAAAPATPSVGALRYFDGRAMQALGTISYGFYIWHDPVLTLTQSAMGGSGAARLYPFVAFALTVFVARLSYRYVETPMLALKDKRFLLAPATGA